MMNQIKELFQRMKIVISLVFSVLGVMLGLLFSISANSAESVGEWKFNDFFLSSQLRLPEPEKGEFALGPSAFSFEWKKSDLLSAHFSVGTDELLPRPIWFTANEQKVTLVETYLQTSTTFGRVRFGLLPIVFGLEAWEGERNWIFPPSFLVEEKWVARRDYGFNYHISHLGYFTEFTAHNGEAGSNRDQQTWFTASWGRAIDGDVIGISSSTGRTKPDSTTGATTSYLPFDPTLESRIRLANFFFKWKGSDLTLAGDISRGEIEQTDNKTQFGNGMIELQGQFNPSWLWNFRWNQTDPNISIENDKRTRYLFGVTWQIENLTSQLSFVGGRLVNEDNTGQNEFYLIWKLSSLGG